MSDSGDASGKAPPSSCDFADASFRQRLRELVDELGSAKVAAEVAGVAQTTIDRWRNGPHMPPLDRVTALCRAAKIHVEWLATGDGPRDMNGEAALSQERTKREQEDKASVPTTQGQISNPEIVLLPRLSIAASAGQGIVPAEEDIEEFIGFKADFLRHLGVNPRNAHILQIKGGSMYPTFRDGDVIVIDASLIEVLEEGFYTIVYGGAVFAKRIQPLRDDSLRIVSDNKADGYVDEIVPASERHTLKIVGRIKGVYRNL